MNLIHKSMLTVVAGAFLVALTGCEQEGPMEKTGKVADQQIEQSGQKIEKAGEAVGNTVENAAAALDDTAITAKIKAEILADPLLKVFEIEVTTTDGVVVLNGVVDSQEGSDRATEISGKVEDVTSVKNNLVIKGN